MSHQAPEEMDGPGSGESLWKVEILLAARSAVSFTF